MHLEYLTSWGCCLHPGFFISLSVSPQVLHRIEETFKRSSSNGLLPKLTFFRDILGEAVPEKLSEVRVHACIYIREYVHKGSPSCKSCK